MKQTVKEGLLRGLSAIFAALLVLMLCLTQAAKANLAVMNRQRGTASYITQAGDTDSDTAYYKPEFSSAEGLEAAKRELAASIAADPASPRA